MCVHIEHICMIFRILSNVMSTIQVVLVYT